jgi:hypothetical protein
MQNADKMSNFPTPVPNPRNSKCGYVYFCKIVNSKNEEYYKIGMSGDIKRRMPLLERDHTGCCNNGIIQLLAIGSSNDMRRTESDLQGIFWDKSYSFVYGSEIQTRSWEYFSFDYIDVSKVIEEMTQRCNCIYRYTSLLVGDFYLPEQRMLPNCIYDLGWWEYRDLRCRVRSKCIGDDCASYEKCRADSKYAMCD